MKKFNLFTLLLLAIGFGFTACDNDDNGDDVTPDQGVTITGIPPVAEIENLGTLPAVTATLTAPDGLASFSITKDGAAFGDEVTFDGETTETVEFTYTAVEADADQNIVFVFTATDEDGDEATVTHVLSVGEAPEVPSEIVVTDNISGDVTWSKATTYILGGRITVLPDATLTIEPGTVIKGQAGAGANSTVLLVARGGILIADGTAEEPIIFTSVADEIVSGQINSPNLDPDVNGLWGGLIVLGSAPIAASDTEIQIEGIPTEDENGLYGGTNAADSSGVIRYVSVRHGGTLIGSGNEINGITFGGVGSGTIVENVEVVANQDDGIEWFGGDVDVTNALIWNAGDDGLDSDQDWNGTCENFIIVSPQGSAFELDGPEGGVEKRGFHSFNNGIVYAGDDIDHLVDWDANTNAVLTNIYFYGWSDTYGFVVDEDPSEAGDQRFRPFESFGGDNSATSNGFEYTLPTGGRPYAEVFENVPDAATSEVALNANTVGGGENAASNYAWTWASASGALESIGLE